LYFLRTNIFLHILFSETLYKLKKEDRHTSEQICYVNKKRHTLLTLGRSSELKKGQVTGRCDKLQFCISVHFVAAAAFQSIDGSRQTGLPTVLVRRTTRFRNPICFPVVLTELLPNKGPSVVRGGASARELSTLSKRLSYDNSE
jgi:hypothetical protein